MADAVAQLQQLGFSEYEARAYVGLVARSSLTGYELAKASGVPRANVYAVLRKLEQRGAVARVDAEGGVRYVAGAPADLLRRLRRQFADRAGAAETSLEGLTRPAEVSQVLNSQGYGALIEQSRVLIDGATQRLLIALWAGESAVLADCLAAATGRGVDVTTLCLQGCLADCAGCRGHIFRYQVAPPADTRWLLLTADDQEVLAGEIGPGGDAVAVRTRQRLLVDLAGGYIRHSIALAAILGDADGAIERLLSPGTRAALAAIGPDSDEGGWLGSMRRLLGRGDATGGR